MIRRVLVVDDEEQVRAALARILERREYRCDTAESAAAARAAVERVAYDAVLCDVNMPQESGLSLVRHLHEQHPDLAVVMVSGVDDPFIAAQALDLGAYGYVTKPFAANQVLIAVANALRRSGLEQENRSYREHLERMVADRTAELTDTLHALRRADEALRASSEEMLALLMRLIEGRDVETGCHIERMSRYAELLARHAGLGEERAQLVRIASAMHDVGKLAVPDGILLKPGRLTPVEFEVVKQHADFGFRMLSRSRQPLLALAATIAHTHHERWDGSGYPLGLSGTAIPLEGRITALADVFDALMSRRVYKPAFSAEESIEVIRQGRGTQFDPELTDLFLSDLDALVEIRRTHPDE